MWTYGHFSASEFLCQCGCGVGSDLMDIDRDLLIKLNEVRERYGPIVGNSGARCAAHNKTVSKVENSAHLTIPGIVQCRAFDIRCTNSSDRSTLLVHLLPRFTRIGLHKSFIHVDVAIGPDYPQHVMWFY